ncbi:UNVERIFIED_CONTAM: hypothetical protein FKN15_010287 [Acipenser sinensis]
MYGTQTKFECPVDFVSCAYDTSRSLSLEKLNGSNTELWLIKAPASFKPESFSGKKVPLIGYETIETGSAATRKIYNVFSSQKELVNTHLLVQGKGKGSVLCGPLIQGYMNVGERFGDCNGTVGPKAIPASPAPQIPAGLKQRFTPFGSSTPPSVGRKRSKIFNECILSGSSGEVTERKKKKKKKDRERREEEEEEERERTELEMEIKEPSEIKEEVFEPEFGEQVDSGRKKKKKKKKDRERREEEERPGLEVEIKEEPPEIKEEVFEPEFGEQVDSGRKKKKDKHRSHR